MNIALTNVRPIECNGKAAKRAVADIVRDGFALVNVNPAFLNPRIAAIRRGMQRVTDDPELARLFPFYVFSEDKYGGNYSKEVGLKLRDDDEHKWFFHHMLAAYSLDKLPKHRNSEYGSFFVALRDLNTKAMEIAAALAEQFDACNHNKPMIYKYGGSMAEVVRAGECIDRVLRYLVRQETTRVDAKPHIDRSIFTIDWGASHKGLKILRKSDNTWVDVDITKPGLIAVFPGKKFGAVTDPERARLGFGTPHGVKYERENNRDRYAIVSFVHPKARLEHARWLTANYPMISEYERSLRIS